MTEENYHDKKFSTLRNNKSYFEKLQLVNKNRRNEKIKSYLKTTGNIASIPENLLDNIIDNLIQSNQTCSNMKTIKTQTDILLSQYKLLKQIYIDNQMRESIEKKFDKYTFTIETLEGNIVFDFSKQFINNNIYKELIQFIRLSNLDEIIKKIFHKSGEYHHIDYKLKRQKKLEKDQENNENLFDHFIHQLSQDSYSIPSQSPISNKYQLSNTNDLLKLNRLDKTIITIAKGVHFRSSSHCFVLDDINISSRFQYDRNILQNICFHFHNYIDNESNIIPKKNNQSQDSNMIKLDIDSKRNIKLILVLCTFKMKKIYRLLESLLKSYILPNISIFYITFEEIKPFLIKYEENSHEILLKNTTILNQNMNLPQSISSKKEFNNNTDINDENTINSTSEQNLFNIPPKLDNTTNKIDFSNEELLFDYFQSSSLILIFMKYFHENYFNTFIKWYTEIILNNSNELLTSNWEKIIEHIWLITSDYEHVEKIFNFPKTNLFLWPTEHKDIDHISIIISSILILPIALHINYENYTMFINGISIVDKHCQETLFDHNICIQLALLRIWLNICEQKTIGIITYNDNLQYFGEYVRMLFTDYDYIHDDKTITTYKSIHGISAIKIFSQQILNEEKYISYDLIMINNDKYLSELSSISSKFSEINKNFDTYNYILLDQLTPLTIGVLIGVYDMAIFFENIIRKNIF